LGTKKRGGGDGEIEEKKTERERNSRGEKDETGKSKTNQKEGGDTATHVYMMEKDSSWPMQRGGRRKGKEMRREGLKRLNKDMGRGKEN